jgi:hypothetical protein
MMRLPFGSGSTTYCTVCLHQTTVLFNNYLLGVAPLYGFLYQATLSFYPPMFLVISVVGYLIVLVLAGITQRGLVQQERLLKKQLTATADQSSSTGQQQIEEEISAMLTNA